MRQLPNELWLLIFELAGFSERIITADRPTRAPVHRRWSRVLPHMLHTGAVSCCMGDLLLETEAELNSRPLALTLKQGRALGCTVPWLDSGPAHACWVDNERVFCFGRTGQWCVMDMHTGRRLRRYFRNTHNLTCAASPSGRLVAAGGMSNNMVLIDLNPSLTEGIHLNRSHDIPFQGSHEGYVSCIRWRSEGSLLSASGDSTCR